MGSWDQEGGIDQFLEVSWRARLEWCVVEKSFVRIADLKGCHFR